MRSSLTIDFANGGLALPEYCVARGGEAHDNDPHPVAGRPARGGEAERRMQASPNLGCSGCFRPPTARRSCAAVHCLKTFAQGASRCLVRR